MLQIRLLVFTRDVSMSCCRWKDDFQDVIHPEGREPGIPRYTEREGEDINLKRARYRSNIFRVESNCICEYNFFVTLATEFILFIVILD